MQLIRQLWLATLILYTSALNAAGISGQELNNSDWLSSTSGSSTNSLPIQSVSFLPVEKAYQLSVATTDTASPTPVLQLHWEIAKGYYLYQHSLQLINSGTDKPLPLNLPAGQKRYDEYFEKELDVHYTQLNLSVELPFTTSELPIELQLHSQGCADAGLCYPPQIQTIKVALDNITNTVTASLVAPKLTPTSTTAASSTPSTPSFTTGLGRSLFIAVISAIFGGVLLNLMPCVFPVLSLKALSLANAHQSPHQQHLHGWCYTLGSIALFVAIAAIMLTLRHAGYAIGWGFHLQSPIVTGGLAYLFFIMALLLSGSYNLGAGVGSIGQKLTEGHSLKSSFFTGALACVVASPCTAPFMGGALGYAVTQPTAIALSVFAALGFGMALPFLLLSYYPELSNHLPKPGRWMESFRQFLAFPLLLTALWLLWVLGRQAGSDAIILLCAGAITIAFAAWLIRQPQPSKARRLIAITLTIGALSLLSLISTNQPRQSQVLSDPGWQPFTEQRLQQLLATGTPVFINLTADWCITCLANEKAVLSRAGTEKAFTEAGVVKLKGDWTNYNPEITNLLSRFGRNGVPLYLLYSGKANIPPLILPQILSEQSINEAVSSLKLDKFADDNPH